MRVTMSVLALFAALAVPAAVVAQEPDLGGIVDLHVHVAPGSRGPRSVTAFEAARGASANGMRAILLKNHYTETASQAYLVSQQVPDVEVYGGIALNRSVGGLNPAAVETMATMTGGLGRMVWLPTFDSEHNAPDADHVRVTRDGALLPELRRVFDVMVEHDLALATGHVSPDESLLVIREARAAGIERIVVTHPASGLVEMSSSTQREAARLGALLEYTLLSVVGGDSVEEFVAQIREVGPENVVLTTDLGQVGNPVHVDGWRIQLVRLGRAGLTPTELHMMTRTNPARLLGID